MTLLLLLLPLPLLLLFAVEVADEENEATLGIIIISFGLLNTNGEKRLESSISFD